MASEREEVFFARVVELGLEDCIPAMKAKGIKTFAGMGFGLRDRLQPADAGPDATERAVAQAVERG